MKKLLATILSILLIISIVPVGAISVAAQNDLSYAAEDIPSNAIAIGSAWELSMICNEYPADGYYYLTRDIDLSIDVAEGGDFYDDGKGWTPIGGKAMPFTGTFNGQGYTIKNLKIDRTTAYTALFGYASGAEIFNLILEDGTVNGKEYASGIIGGAENSEIHDLEVKNCEISGSSKVGGIVGYGSTVTIYDCNVDSGTITATSSYCGGIGGQLVNMSEVTVSQCENSSTVTGTSYLGGMFGELTGTSAIIDNCLNTGDVKGTSNNVAGIVGSAASVKIQNCENTGAIESKTGSSVTDVGGVAGNCQEVIKCINRGDVTATSQANFSNRAPVSYVGGIAGEAVKVSTCFNDGDLYVAGGTYHYTTQGGGTYLGGGGYTIHHYDPIYTYGGGIAGNADTVEFCYNTGTISSKETSVTGALVSGNRAVTVLNCYSDANTLPLVRNSSNTITNCYNTNGIIAASGTATNCYYFADAESGIGALRTKRQLRAKITFVDWDFDTVWTMGGNEDYRFPELIEVPSEFVKSLTSVSLVSTPEKTTYLEGKEVLDVSEIKLKLYYDNETQEQIDVTEDMVSGFDNSVVGSKTIKVTYQDFFDEFSVVIVAKSVESIEMVTSPSKLEYLEGKELLDVTGAQIRVYYNNDTTQLMNLTPNMVSGFDNTLVGKQTLSVEYQGKRTQFDVEIIPKSIVGIEVHTLPQVLDYKEGDQLDLSGGAITIKYDNDTSEQKDMSECEVSIEEFSEYGQFDVVVVFDGFETNFSVNVGHEYSEHHSYDSSFHWLECACGGTSDKISHQYDNTCDTGCNICDYVRTITHTYSATCDEICNVCGCERTALANHEYDNACDAICNMCTHTRVVPDHIFDDDCDDTCNECGLERDVPDHVYDNACDAYCNVCNDEREVESHKKYIYSFANSSSYPFSYSEGVYSSTNKSHSSSATATITALVSGTIKIRYYTYTESYDKLTIKLNSTTKVTASGSTSWTTVDINVVAGDKIYLTYSKDYSVNSGTDTVYFEIVGESVVSTDNINPTCITPVICDICNAVVKPAKNHSYTNDCDTACNTCGASRSITHNYSTATCTKAKTCTVCGVTSGSSLGHDYTNLCDDTCNTCGATRSITHNYSKATCTKAKTCTICKATSGSALGHDYTNSCDKTCNTCGATRSITHDYSAATCTKAKTCTVCKVTSGSALGHKYTNSCDKTCNVCKATRTITHTYKTTITKATTTKDGKKVEKCSVCGTSKTTTIKYAKTLTLSATSYTYDGTVKKPTVTVKDSAGKVISSSNYTVTYANGRKNAGTYKVTVKMKGNYSGSKTLIFKINPASASKCTTKLSATTYAYNGSVKTPTVTVKNAAGTTLKKNTDYTITYASGRKNVGTYKVTIKFKGNYNGTKALTFTVVPTTKTSMSGLVGDKLSIGAKSNTKITYTSSNKKVATVDSKGVVTAVKAGTATITVKSGSISKKVTVKVTTPTVKVSASKSSMYVGETLKLTATTNPKSAKVTWSVNDTKIAKISSSGTLTALKDGTVTVTAKITYKDKTYKATYKVKVTVEYPDVTVWISKKSKYTDSYGFTIANHSSRSLKILNKGYVYVGGDSSDIESLFLSVDGEYGYYKWVSLKPNSGYVTMLACLEDKLLFLSSSTVWLYLHVEYGGEEFILKCKTDYSILENCYEITWLK